MLFRSNAANGTVGLGAGSEILLAQTGNERISILAGNVSAPAAKGVDNVGTVQAVNAELQAAGAAAERAALRGPRAG